MGNAVLRQLILEAADDQYQKIARLVGTVMEAHKQPIADIDVHELVKALVNEGKLEAVGNIDVMRFSEVRLVRVHK